MIGSKIMNMIHKKKKQNGDFLADAIIDLCFVTSYKIEDLLSMPPSKRDRLIERYMFHFGKKEKKK